MGASLPHRRPWLLLLLCAAILALTANAPAQAQVGRAGGPVSSRMVSVVVKLDDDPVVSYRGTVPGLAPTTREAPGAGRASRGTPPIQAYRAHLAQKHAAFEAAASALVPGARVTHRFDVVLGGVAMTVPEDRISQLAQLPGVKAVYRDPRLRLHTDTSPQFIGAVSAWAKLGGHERAGEGIVVGILDSGIWPEHPSFSDPDAQGKLYPPPPTVPAGCDFGGGANPGPSFTCNNKLIGAYRFMASYDRCVADGDCVLAGDFTSARGSDGHGTHTASTAAGNAKVAAQIFGIDRKHVSGVAPRAHVIAYKVCGPETCFGSDAVAAIQQAILDDVDVINFSIGGGSDPYQDVVELAFRDAYAAGVFVAASVGNSGPAAGTAEHLGPWVTTVAASTETRSFQTTLSLVGEDGVKLKLAGVSVTPGIATARPVVISDGDPSCEKTTPADLGGKIVVCEGGINRLEKSFNVAQRGAAGMILVNDADDQNLLSDNHSVPSVHITKGSGDTLTAFLGAHRGVSASFPVSVARQARGDVIARFSSRGGPLVLGVSKPDLTAPGVQILGAQTPEPADPADPPGQLFQAIAGTSMSSPHVAGAAALLKSLHPDWTPGQIKSALMTTASTAGLVQHDGVTPFTPFDAGAGRVALAAAQAPGVTFDVPVSDYVAHEDDLWTVNQPSIFVPDIAPNVLTVQRTARSVIGSATTWALSVVPPASPGLVVTVTPTLTVPAGGSTPFDLQIDKTGVPAGETRHVTLRLTSSVATLHMPITAAGLIARPDLIVTEVTAPSTGTRGAPLASSATIKNVGTAPAGAFFFQVYLSRDDATVSADDVFYWFCDIGSLAPDETAFCDFAGPVPSSIAAGTYHLVVRVDDGGVIAESNEKNNVNAAGPITID